MPRPRVRLEDRQRSVKACIPCKRSKVRCHGSDENGPCTTCKRRSREDECVFKETVPSKGRRVSRLNSLGSSDRPSSVAVDIPSTSNGRNSADGSAEPPPDEDESPQSRMLLSSKLHKVYIGESASLSYLQLLRQILKQRVGPCAFTENEFSNYMLETDILVTGPAPPGNLDLAQREALVQCYKDATSGILDLYNDVDIAATVADLYAPVTAVPAAVIYLVLAIGAQCRGTESSDLTYASTFFAKARVMAFESMLCDPSPDMVAVFVLMAYYMLGACHRNAAYMYLGVAFRAACALGLHRADRYRALPQDECRTQLNIWKSLRVLDTIVNSILGRSSGSTSTLDEEKRLQRLCNTVGELETPQKMASQAAFDICPFIDELERYGSNQSAASAERFLQRLQQWSKSLPPQLRRWTEASSEASRSSSREHYIGGTHVACVYYFAVMLTTRRFLTVHLLSKVRQQGKAPDSASPATKLREQHGSTSLAHVCLNAAINLAKVGHNALVYDRMLNNMCLIKAWMFAAGLLLGFHLFANPNGSDPEAEEAFDNAQMVLQKLAALSPQARHYHDIFSSLAEAINLYQKRYTDERRRIASRFMDQIFTFDAGSPLQGPDSKPPHSSTQTTDSGSGAAAPCNEGTTSWPNVESPDYPLSLGQDVNMDASAAAFTMNDFSFDWQPFAPFFDDLM